MRPCLPGPEGRIGWFTMILSIIIPVYNVEAYLAECLDSVLECDLTDCELILSLRESGDRSTEICKAYCARFPFVKTVMQSGTGLSDARNCGVQAAQGEYILYIDSDDRVDSAVLSDLIGRLRAGSVAADVIVTDFYHVEHPSGKTVPYFQIGAETPDRYGMQFLPVMLRRRQCFWNVWRYVYKSSFLHAHEITFRENILSEDVDYTTSVFIAEPDILFSHSPFYYYNVGRGDSLMDQATLHRLRETVEVLSDSVGRLRRSSFRYADAMIAQFQFEYILNMALAVEIKAEDRKSALSLFGGYPDVLRGSADPVVKCFAVFIRLAGVNASARLLHCLKLIRRRIRGRNNTEGRTLWLNSILP